METQYTDVLVVGASAAGLGVVERLRSQGFGGSIEVVGAETHLPYDRPPLSKQVLSGQWAPQQAELRDRSVVDGFAARWTLGRRAVDLDVDGHSVGLDDGRRVHYGTVVLATGLSARALPWQRQVPGVHAVRTIDDCLALRRDLLTVWRVVVVGAGVLGCEVAATSRSMGLDVTLVDPAPTPMHAQLGPELGGAVARLHTEHGTTVRMDTPVADLLHEGGAVRGVRLADGGSIAADVVVIAAGSVTNTAWLQGSGLGLSGGVECDSRCRAAPDVYAAGDVARWYHEHLGRSIRLENRTNATQQAVVVADNMLGAARAYTPTSYYWTDQYEVKIQVSGELTDDAVIHVTDGGFDQSRFSAVVENGGRIVGAVGWKHPRGFREAAGRIGRQLTLDTAS
jgi:3-phenylpropionate/trans-cinnamate dioxygenase ferredoxin reductase component